MVKALTLASSALSFAGMANALFLKNSRPDVSTALMWFSTVTGVVAITSQAADVLEPPKKKEPERLHTKGNGASLMTFDENFKPYYLPPPRR